MGIPSMGQSLVGVLVTRAIAGTSAPATRDRVKREMSDTEAAREQADGARCYVSPAEGLNDNEADRECDEQNAPPQGCNPAFLSLTVEQRTQQLFGTRFVQQPVAHD